VHLAVPGRAADDGDFFRPQGLDRVGLGGVEVPGRDEPGPSVAQRRNRFAGLVTRVVRDTVMAQVEIQAGPHRFVSLLSREAADELGLEPGMLAIAAVKSTNVSVEIPRAR
jgi:molybdopterin-binding protein